MHKSYFIAIISTLLFTLTTLSSNAQVGGVSASKLGAINAYPVPAKKIEMEPSFSSSWSSQTWSGTNKTDRFESPDSLFTGQDFGFRFTYGISDKWEMGFSVPIDGSGFSLASKNVIAQKGKMTYATLLGLNVATGNEGINSKKKSYDQSTLVAGGVTATFELSSKFSIDWDAQLQFCTNNTIEKHTIDQFLNMDLGYYVRDEILAIAGLSYNSNQFKDENNNSNILIANIGASIEPAKNFLMVFGAPIPLTGKNNDIEFGFSFALTITLE